MSTTKEQKIRIGLFAIVTAALLALVLIEFVGLRFWKGHKTYQVVFQSSVIGLDGGADVSYNGVKVGTVKSVGIDKQDVRRVRVLIEVDDDTPIRTDTHAYLSMGGITGVKTLDLRSSEAHAPALAEDSVIPVGIGTLDKLTKQAEDIADHADAVMKHVDHIAERADEIVDNVARPMQEIMPTARSAPTGLAHAGAELDSTIAENRAAMMDIRQASRTIKELAREVKARPSRLLFGSPAPERKLP